MLTDVSNALHMLKLLSNEDGCHSEDLIRFLCIEAIFQFVHGFCSKLFYQEEGAKFKHCDAGITQFSSIPNESSFWGDIQTFAEC